MRLDGEWKILKKLRRDVDFKELTGPDSSVNARSTKKVTGSNNVMGLRDLRRIIRCYVTPSNDDLVSGRANSYVI